MSTNTTAIQLVSCSKNQLAINNEAVHLLESIDTKLVIVAIAGPPQVGKSSLLNWLIDENNCFPVSASPQASTNGIYMWLSPDVQNDSNGDQFKVLYLDLEGLKSQSKGTLETANYNLFCLVVMLSSTLIYCSRGNLDENSISDISFMSDLARSFRISERDDPDRDMMNFGKVFPKLLWVARDVQYDLMNPEHRSLTPTQVMESILTPTKGFDRITFERNRVRNIITSFFTERKCVFMVHPLINREYLLEVPGCVLRANLNIDFHACLSIFEKELISNFSIKRVCDNPLTGSTFHKLLTSYMKSFNTNMIPIINYAWREVCTLETQSAIQTSLRLYCKRMDTYASADNLPREEKDLFHANEIAIKDALQLFRSRCIGENAIDSIDHLVDNCFKQFQNYEENNKKSSQILAESILLDLYEKQIKPKLSPDRPFRSVYLSDLQALRNDWRTMTFQFHQLVKGPGKYITLSEFCRESLLDAITAIVTTIRNQFDETAVQAVGATQQTFDELTETLQSNLLELETIQGQLNESNNINDTLKSKNEEYSKKIKDLTMEFDAFRVSKITTEAESQSVIKALEGALHTQTALCVVKDETIMALKADLNLATSRLQTEMNNSQNYRLDMESAQKTLQMIEDTYKKQLQDKDEVIMKVQRQVDEKVWQLESLSRQKEMEMSSTSSEIITFQSNQLLEHQKKIDELKLEMKQLNTDWEELYEKKENEMKGLNETMQKREELHQKEVQDLNELLRQRQEAWGEEKGSYDRDILGYKESIEKLERELALKMEEISGYKAEITRFESVERVFQERVHGYQEQLTSLEAEQERLKSIIENSNYSKEELHQVLEDLKLDNDLKTTTITQQLAALDKYKEEVEGQKGRLTLLEFDAQKRSETIENLNKEIDGYKQDKLELKAVIVKLDDEGQELTKRKNELTDEVAALKKANEEQDTTISGLSAVISQLRTEAEESEKKFSIEIQSYQDKIFDIEHQLLETEAREKEGQGLRDVLLQINQELTENNSQLQEENVHLKKTYGSMHENFDKAREEIEGKWKNEEITKKTLADALIEKESQLSVTLHQLEVVTRTSNELDILSKKLELDLNEKIIIVDTLEKRIDELESIGKGLVIDVTTRDKMIEDLKNEKKTFYEEMEYVIATAKQSESHVKEELEKVKAQLHDRDVLLLPTNKALQELTEKLAEANVNLERNSVVIKDLEERVNTLETQNQQLNDDLAAKNDVISELQCSQAILQSEKEAIDLKFENNYEEFVLTQAEIKVLRQRVKDVEEEKTQFDLERERLREDDSVLQRMLSSTSAEKFQLQTIVNTLESSLQSSKDRIGELDSTILIQKELLQERDFTIQQLESSVTEINERAREYRSTIDEQLLAIRSLQSALDTANERVELLSDEKMQVEKKWEELESSFKRSNGEQTERIIEQNITIDNLEQRIAGLQKMVDEDLIGQLRQDVDEKTQEISELTHVYIKLRQRVSDLEEEATLKANLVEELSRSNREKDAQVREATAQIEKVKSTVHTDQDQLLELNKAKKLSESYHGELLIARERIQELEKAFQDTIEKMMISSLK